MEPTTPTSRGEEEYQEEAPYAAQEAQPLTSPGILPDTAGHTVSRYAADIPPALATSARPATLKQPRAPTLWEV